MQFLRKGFLWIILLVITGCTTIDSSPQIEIAYGASPWGIAIFANNTETPQAGSRAMSITANILRAKGVLNLTTYQPYGDCNLLTVCPNSALPLKKILRWARQNHLRYVMVGAVNEWQYKVGLDGEPSVGISMQLYNVYTGRVIWSSVGSRIGSARSGLGNTAQTLIEDILRRLGICL